MEKKERLLSLDVFRGITIAGMILVNNPGSWADIYPPLRHAAWNGCTPTDLVFPFFLFIVGVAITLSLTKRKSKGDSDGQLMKHIFRRSLILFALGVFLNGFPWFELSTLRIPGVLQRIALVYFFSSWIFLKADVKKIAWISVACLLIYWVLMTIVPVPGRGAPGFEPENNLAAWFDNLLLGGHLWRYTKVWDPEGILSTIPAISSGLAGVLTGYLILNIKEKKDLLLYMFLGGNLLMFGGYLWDGIFPMNKNIWSSSYVLYTSGLALVFLSVLYYFIDYKKIKWWSKPFIVYGINAIAVYVLSGIMGRLFYLIKFDDVSLKTIIYNSVFASWLSPVNASLFYALFYVTFWLGIMWIFYRKNIIIKV